MRATISRHSSEHGSWTYIARAPAPRLAPLMYRELYGFEQERARFSSWLEAPRPAPELEGVVLSLEDLFGAEGRTLADRVRATSGWDERFDLVERFLLRRLFSGPEATPAVAWAWQRLRSSAGNCRVEQLAAEIGCSRRYLSSRFSAEVGLGPKAAGRLIRFEQVCRRMRAQPARWAEVAANAGYYDQPHLNRDFRELAGTSPGEFLRRCIPGGGVVGDGIPFVQDGAGAAA